jgi:hypothetical protein
LWIEATRTQLQTPLQLRFCDNGGSNLRTSCNLSKERAKEAAAEPNDEEQQRRLEIVGPNFQWG